MANFLRCLESEKGREEMWPGSTSTFGCPLWLGGIEGSQGTPEEAASSSSWEGVLTASCEEEREDRQPCWDSAPVLCHCLLLIPRIWSLCPWAVHLHEPKLLCFGRGECRKWKGDPRRPLAHPCSVACELFSWKWDHLFSKLNRARSSVTSNWPCWELVSKSGAPGASGAGFLVLREGITRGSMKWKEKKKGVGGKQGEKRQLAIAVESSSGEHSFHKQPKCAPKWTQHPFLFIFYLHTIYMCIQNMSVAKFQIILTVYEQCQRQWSKRIFSFPSSISHPRLDIPPDG